MDSSAHRRGGRAEIRILLDGSGVGVSSHITKRRPRMGGVVRRD